MIHELLSPTGEKKNYRVFKIKPTVGGFVKINELSEEKLEESLNGSNRYRDLSFDKVYQIHRIIDTFQVLIKDNMDNAVQVYPSQYEVVEEISNEELKRLQDDQKLVKTIDKLVKKTVNR